MESTIGKEEVIKLLSPSLGIEQAQELVENTAKSLGYHGNYFNFEQVITILETLSQKAGTVGIIAKFAKSRAALLF